MDKPVVRISVRNLVEFILRSGDLDNRGGAEGQQTAQKNTGQDGKPLQSGGFS